MISCYSLNILECKNSSFNIQCAVILKHPFQYLGPVVLTVDSVDIGDSVVFLSIMDVVDIINSVVIVSFDSQGTKHQQHFF